MRRFFSGRLRTIVFCTLSTEVWVPAGFWAAKVLMHNYWLAWFATLRVFSFRSD